MQVNIWCSLTVFPLQSSTYRAWSFISDEMYASADAHRYDTTMDEYALFIIHVSCCCVFILGLFFQHTGKCSQPRCYPENPSNPRWTRQKKKTGISPHVHATYAYIHIRIYRSMFTLSLVCTQLDNAVEKSGKLVLTNWSEQIKVRKYFEKCVFLFLRNQIKQPNIKKGIQKQFLPWGE